MGLKIKAGPKIVVYEGSCGEYGNICAALAAAAGYDTLPADGTSARKRGERRVDFEMLPRAENDILIILIGHGDSDGIIANAYCKPLANRMLEVAKRVKDQEIVKSVEAMAFALFEAAKTDLDVVYA